MTEPTAVADAQTPPAKPSFFEDIIDVFFNPIAVFRRRANSSPWPALITCAVLSAIIALATFNVISPVLDAEWTRNSAKILKANPNMTQEMIDKSRGITQMTARYAPIILVPLMIFVIGVVAWLISKLVSAKESFNAAIVVVAYAYLVRVLGGIVSAIIALLTDPSKITGVGSVSVGPLRFMNPDTSSPIAMALAGRLDVFLLWFTILIAVGIYATGKVSKGRAIAFGILLWVVGAIPTILGGWRAAKG
jgi:hypothetical protein